MTLNKRKILLITLRSDLGGGPYHIDILLENLTIYFDFYVAAPLNKPYGFKWQQLLGRKNFFELPFRSFNLVRFLKLTFFIKNNSIGLVHSHGKGAGIYGRLLKLFVPGIKVIHTFHGLHVQQYNSVQKKIYIFLERMLNVLTHQFINVSSGEQNICLQYKLFNKKKSRVIYNSINPVKFPTQSKTSIRHVLSLPLDKFIIISVLRFNYQKNLSLMLEIAELIRNNPNILILLIGDGEQKEETEKIISKKNIKNVNLPGFRTNVNEYLFASDIYLSTSFWEGLPYSLIEAASFGLPIVATDVIGNNEIVKDNQNGYLFPLNKPELAVDKILRLEKSPDLLNQMGKNALKIIENNFQINTMNEKIKDVYSTIINPNNN